MRAMTPTVITSANLFISTPWPSGGLLCQRAMLTECRDEYGLRWSAELASAFRCLLPARPAHHMRVGMAAAMDPRVHLPRRPPGSWRPHALSTLADNKELPGDGFGNARCHRMQATS